MFIYVFAQVMRCASRVMFTTFGLKTRSYGFLLCLLGVDGILYDLLNIDTGETSHRHKHNVLFVSCALNVEE